MLVVVYAVVGVGSVVYGMFFVCFWVVLLCPVIVQKKPKKHKKT